MRETNALLSLEGLSFTTIELDQSDHIFTLTLNRPEKKNAINETMVNEIIYALDYAKQERDIRVVVIVAKGNVFCAGADLKVMSGNPEGQAVSNVPKRGEAEAIPLRLYHLYKPSIAKIQGSVYAGALLMVCNVTHAIAANHVTFSAPEILRGIWPFQVMGGLFRVMPQRDGLDFIMRGQPISAEQAVKNGLINGTVCLDKLDTRVACLARELAGLAPATMQAGLQAFRAQQNMTFDEALPYLKQQLYACLQSDDAKEGIAAFLEKRKPEWD
jgi:methylglutaconyl-CoA hydratase